MKFKKKPVTIDAEQWFKNGDHSRDNSVEKLCGAFADSYLTEGSVVRRYRHPSKNGEHKCTECGSIYHNHGWIDNLEGGHRVCPGDWIIRGVHGEYYSCKPDIFKETYDPVVFGEHIEYKNIGLYDKFTVSRTDGRSEPGKKHENCKYFVIDLDHDEFAHPAIKAYAEACKEKYPDLSRDLVPVAIKNYMSFNK